MGLLSSIRENVLPLFSQETRVARYVALPESVVGVTVPGDAPGVIGSQWAPRFDAPGVVAGLHAVLLFSATPVSSEPRFSVRLTRSSEHLMIHTFTDASTHSWHQIVRPNVIQPADNELIFNVSGDGIVRFSDVVVVYTSDQLTIRKEPVFTE